MNEERFYTYIYYDPTRNNEPFYAGKGCRGRFLSHLTRKGIHPLIQRIAYIRKQGKEPIIGVYSGYDEEFALFLEEELITKFGRKDLGTGTLVNLTNGGDSGVMNKESVAKRVATRRENGSYNYTVETKNKMSEAKKGKKQSEEMIAARVAGMIGHHVTDEAKIKIGNANRGLKRTPEQNKANSERVKAYNERKRNGLQ